MTYKAHDFIRSRGNVAQAPAPVQTEQAQPRTYTTTVTNPIRVPAISDNHTVAAVVQDGTYTLVYKDGSHFTFKINTPTRGGLKGKQIVSYLSGSDNESDFTGFGFLNPNGTVSVWKRFKAESGQPRTKLQERAEHLDILFTMPARLEQAGLDYAMTSGKCRRCNHKLTVPASIHRGYGPECIKYARGFAY